MKYATTVAPAGRPVDWTTAKAHLRLDSDAEQTYVEALIDAATDYAQEALASSLLSQTITATFYAGEAVELPRGPLAAVTSVTDDDGQTITDFDVERVGHLDRLRINVEYTAPLTVVYTAGYANAAAVPASIRQAILVHVGTLYERRESVADRSLSVVPHSLADFYRLKSRNAGVS